MIVCLENKLFDFYGDPLGLKEIVTRSLQDAKTNISNRSMASIINDTIEKLDGFPKLKVLELLSEVESEFGSKFPAEFRK